MQNDSAVVEMDAEDSGEHREGIVGDDHSFDAAGEIASVPSEDAGRGLSEAPSVEAARTLRGAHAHYRGQLIGAFIGRLIGARRTKQYANHHEVNGIPFQIRTSSRRTFTINRDTEPDMIIVAAKVRDTTLARATRYAIFGVRREDAIARGRKSASTGHAKSGHLMVSLGQIAREPLGTLIVPDEAVLANDSGERGRLLSEIDRLDPELDHIAIRAARAFLSGASANDMDLDSEESLECDCDHTIYISVGSSSDAMDSAGRPAIASDRDDCSSEIIRDRIAVTCG